MVDLPDSWTNTSYLPDSIDFIACPRQFKPDDINALYVDGRLSASQIATEVGLSKTTVLRRLNAIGVKKARIGRSADIYQYPHNPPYGHYVIGGRLLPDRQEMAIVRLILNLRDRERLGWREIVNCLNERKKKPRNAKLWSIGTIRKVYCRWQGKL